MPCRLVLTLALCLALCMAASACGEAPGPREPTFVGVPGLPWAQVTQVQVEAARTNGVPVARVDPDGARFVYIPAGSFQREVDGANYEVNLGVGFYIQLDARSGMTHHAATAAAASASARDPIWDYRLPTEAEWAYARRFLPERAGPREWMLDRFAALPTWIVSDPHGPREGATYVVRDGKRRAGLEPEAQAADLGFRFVSPLGYGLGEYGATQVTFRLVDEFADRGAQALSGGYDLRVISMNDRLQARTLGVDAHWRRVRDPGSPVTLSMVPGAYYVYAERALAGQVLRGKEMKFYVADDPVERTVPIPEKNQERYGSGGREQPR